MRFLIGLVLSLACVEANAGYSAFGMLELSCGRYVSEINGNERTKTVYGWWLAGFVTGTNLVKDRIVSTDTAGYEAWVKKYCEEHPLETFQKAVIELDKELDKKNR
jgi:hypothetical protein